MFTKMWSKYSVDNFLNSGFCRAFPSWLTSFRDKLSSCSLWMCQNDGICLVINLPNDKAWQLLMVHNYVTFVWQGKGTQFRKLFIEYVEKPDPKNKKMWRGNNPVGKPIQCCFGRHRIVFINMC